MSHTNGTYSSWVRNNRGVVEAAAVALGFVMLTLVLTYPAVFYLRDRFIGDGYDGFQNVWNMWWMRKALFELHVNPYFTDRLFHPQGVSLILHTFNPFNALLSLPLQAVFSMTVTYNIVVLFSFAASGITMYYLARYLTGSRMGAFIAGAVFTFSPYHFAHGLGHLQLIAMQWLPVYILFVLITLDRGGLINSFLAALFLLLTTMCSWYYAAFGLMFTAGIVAVRVRRLWRTPTILRDLAIGMAAYAVVIAPLALVMLRTMHAEPHVGAHNPATWAADLVSFFVPGEISTFRELTWRIWSQWSGNAAENSSFLGYAALAATVYGVWRRPRARFWGVSALVFAVLSMGPYLRIMGTQTAVRLPYLLLYKLVPPFRITGVPVRFDVMVRLCMGIAIAFGVGHWMARLGFRDGSAWRARVKRIAVPVLLLVLILIEYASVPIQMIKVDVPSFYHVMREEPDDYAVIDVPNNERWWFELIMYASTIHEKKLVAGYVARFPTQRLEFLRSTPVVSTLLSNNRIPPESVSPSRAREVLNELDVRYIITHEDRFESVLKDHWGFPVEHREGGMTVYRVNGIGAEVPAEIQPTESPR